MGLFFTETCHYIITEEMIAIYFMRLRKWASPSTGTCIEETCVLQEMKVTSKWECQGNQSHTNL